MGKENQSGVQINKLKLLGDVMGLRPFPLRLKQAMITIRGAEDVPKSIWGWSSFKQLYPCISPKLWRGKAFLEGKVIISNLYNHTQTPISKGWSARKTQTRDFRGGGLTYDSHNGTDFAIPVGTRVLTAAPGEVVAVMSEFNRGGLKIFIEHGNGLMTTYAHLARALVQVGDIVQRGQVIAISGYSGLDGAVTYPFGIPHVHFNVWLNNEPVDPFPYHDKTSMWRAGELPACPTNQAVSFRPSEFDSELVLQAISYCKTASVRTRLSEIACPRQQAFHTIIHKNYYPTRFSQRVNLYAHEHNRQALLDLPFSADDFDGVVFLDDLLEDRRRKRRAR
jgi:murein DD-endopeptidase